MCRSRSASIVDSLILFKKTIYALFIYFLYKTCPMFIYCLITLSLTMHSVEQLYIATIISLIINYSKST